MEAALTVPAARVPSTRAVVERRMACMSFLYCLSKECCLATDHRCVGKGLSSGGRKERQGFQLRERFVQRVNTKKSLLEENECRGQSPKQIKGKPYTLYQQRVWDRKEEESNA